MGEGGDDAAPVIVVAFAHSTEQSQLKRRRIHNYTSIRTLNHNNNVR